MCQFQRCYRLNHSGVIFLFISILLADIASFMGEVHILMPFYELHYISNFMIMVCAFGPYKYDTINYIR